MDHHGCVSPRRRRAKPHIGKVPESTVFKRLKEFAPAMDLAVRGEEATLSIDPIVVHESCTAAERTEILIKSSAKMAEEEVEEEATLSATRGQPHEVEMNVDLGVFDVNASEISVDFLRKHGIVDAKIGDEVLSKGAANVTEVPSSGMGDSGGGLLLTLPPSGTVSAASHGSGGPVVWELDVSSDDDGEDEDDQVGGDQVEKCGDAE